jgi:hypothetical protein
MVILNEKNMKALLKKIPLLSEFYFVARWQKDLLVFLKGYLYYLKHKVSPVNAMQEIVNSFTATDGEFNRAIANILTSFKTKHKLNPQNGILGNEVSSKLVEQLKKDGYYLFESKLPNDILKKLQDFALQSPAKPLVNINGKFEWGNDTVYDSAKLISTKYNFTTQNCIENETIQQLCTDESILWLMQEYLGASPVLDLLAMWWSTTYKHGAESEAAQLFHFDMDRIKFIKIFFYLKDVTPENGPHCFVRGSHLKRPYELLRRGYSRISDEDIQKYYPKEDILELCGEAGTILVVDTSGFHKGKPLINGERLLLQFEFAVSMYGANYPKLKLTEKITKLFRESMDKYGDTYKEIFEKAQ